MPKNGSSRSKRRARRLAAQQNLRYTEALRHSSPGDTDTSPDTGDARPLEAGTNALDALHAGVEQVKAADAAHPAAAGQAALRALVLTARANDLIDQALLEAEFEVYWPGEWFLHGDRRHYLDVAVQRLGAVYPGVAGVVEDVPVRVLTSPEFAPQSFEPMMVEDVLYPPDETDTARQLLAFRTRGVALANKAVWEQVGLLLGRALGGVEEPHQRAACAVAALMVEEILAPRAGRARRDVDRRVLAITVGRRSAAELVADEQLMQALGEAVAATAQSNGWSPLSAVSAELERVEPSWLAERWGYTSTIQLIAATGRYDTRTVTRKGTPIAQARPRHR